MSKFNLANNHPLIPNANTYICQKKFVSIHSTDRDITRFPDSSSFEITLPQDYLNVQTIRLASWSFPANYNVFSGKYHNLNFVFEFTEIYNPADHATNNPLLSAIYAALNQHKTFIITIETGFYNPDQMMNELTNRMNTEVTTYLKQFFETNTAYSYALDLFVEYTDFVVMYNSVKQNLWFGNRSSGFAILNNSVVYKEARTIENSCSRALPEFANWGLPFFLGFTREIVSSKPSINVNEYRFYYGNVSILGDNGVWITPETYPGAKVHFLQAPLKINFMGPAYFYMELNANSTTLNSIDETSPYNLSSYTITSNNTNGIVNAAFAKIAIPTTPISQWFDEGTVPYKWFDPPAERIRKLKVTLRYHDGQLVDFNSFEYSFMIEFTLLSPQIERRKNVNTFCGTDL